MKRMAIPLLLILALACVGAWHLYKEKTAADTGLFNGTVEATEVKLSSELLGKVVEIVPQEGDRVEKGAVVVRLDHDALDAQLAQAQAAMIAASGQRGAVDAGIKNAQVNLGRSENLLGAGSISEQQFDMVNTQAEVLSSQKRSANGQYKQAEAMAQLVKTQIARATVAAPIAGTVLQRSVEPGEMVMPGSALLTLADLDNPWVRIYIPETDLGKVKLGQTVQVFSDSFPGKIYEGKVVNVAGEAEFTPKNVQTQKERVRLVFGVKVAIRNPNGELKIGMPVDAKLVEKEAISY